MNNVFNTPIAFLIFRRPEETARVFQVIRKMKPETLFIIADGPRNSEEKILSDNVRKVVENIDWPCKILKKYSEVNLGCNKCCTAGVNWVFDNVDKAIIIEDDCLPNESFFYFCQDLLNKYEDDARIMHISGINVNENRDNKNNESYHFSSIAQLWGWASWRRAWKKYDFNMKDWPIIKKENRLQNVLNDKPAVDYFTYLFEKMYNYSFGTWDIPWTYTCMKENGLCIVPNKNLIQNIGFGQGATHSIANKGYIGEMKLEALTFPLIHPEKIDVDKTNNEVIYKKVFGIQTRIGQKILWFCKSNFPKTYNQLRSFSQNIKLLMK